MKLLGTAHAAMQWYCIEDQDTTHSTAQHSTAQHSTAQHEASSHSAQCHALVLHPKP